MQETNNKQASKFRPNSSYKGSQFQMQNFGSFSLSSMNIALV